VRVPVRDLLSTQEAPALLEGSKDKISDSEPILAAEVVESWKVGTALVDWRDHRQTFGDAERMVLTATCRGDVHDARPLLCPNITPRDDAMRGTIGAECLCYGWGGIKRGAIAPSDQLAPLLCFKHRGTGCTAAERSDAARGTEFDRLFLTYMIQHHRGAVAMVKTLFSAQGAGQDETVFKFANDVEVDQSTEIKRMFTMMLEMGFAPPA
jgi:hypothetical protein